MDQIIGNNVRPISGKRKSAPVFGRSALKCAESRRFHPRLPAPFRAAPRKSAPICTFKYLFPLILLKKQPYLTVIINH